MLLSAVEVSVMRLELDETELTALQGALRMRLAEMMRELVRTDQRPYRQELKGDVRALEVLLVRCERLAEQGPPPRAHA